MNKKKNVLKVLYLLFFILVLHVSSLQDGDVFQ